MSAPADARLRALERRWRQTNSPNDEDAFLAERIRFGDLPPERLALVRFLRSNHGSSLQDRRDPTLYPIVVPARRENDHATLRLLNDRIVTRLVDLELDGGAECWVRTGLALTRRALEVWLHHVDDATEADRYAPCRLLTAVRDRFLTGTSQAFGQELFATEQVDERQHYRWGASEVTAPMAAVSLALSSARLATLGEHPALDGPGPSRMLLGNMIYEACVVLSLRLGHATQRPYEGQLRPVADLSVGLNAVLHALAEELVPWALGTGDPVSAPGYLARLSPLSSGGATS